MKKRLTINIIALTILPLFLTGCYTQLATQNDLNSTIPSNQSYDDYAYQDEEVSSSGYFDESDTVDYYYEGEEDVDSTGEVVINNYYGYDPYEDDDYYPYNSSVSFSLGFGYTRFYYPWYTGWYFPYYCYPAYYYPSYNYCFYPSYYYSYYPAYYPYYSYGGYYGNYHSPKYKTRSGYVSRIRNTGGRGYGDTRRNPNLTKTERTINSTGRVVSGLGIKNRNVKERDLLSLGSEKRNETKRIGTKKKSTLTRDRTKTNNVKRTLGVKNTDRTKNKNFGTKSTDTRLKRTKRTRSKDLTTQRNNMRTKKNVRKNTKKYTNTNRNKTINRNKPTKKYSKPRKTSTGKNYKSPKRNTNTRSYNPPRNTRSYSPPRTNTTRSSSPPRTTSRGSGNRSGGKRR